MVASYRLTWRPEPFDPRDRTFAERFGAIATPEIVDMRPYVAKVLDQGMTGACVAHAVAQAIRTAQRVRGIGAPLPSRDLIYKAARVLDRDGDVNIIDEGTFVRSAMRACADIGFCDEALAPWSEEPANLNALPTWHDERAAYDTIRLAGYYRLPDGGGRADAIRTALTHGLPVAFGTYVDASFHVLKSLDVWDLAGNTFGGHSMCIVGYDNEACLVCNSWDTTFGEGGFCRIGWKTMTSTATSDLWVPAMKEAA